MSGMNSENWQDRLAAGRPKPRAYIAGQIVQYEDMAASLMQESALPSIVGKLEDFERKNPMMHQDLMRLCRMAAIFEIGESTGMLPMGSSAETYSKMIGLLDDCMSIDPKFEDKSLQEIRSDATKAAAAFKAVCHREITDPNGIISCALKSGLSQLHQPVTELTGNMTGR